MELDKITREEFDRRLEQSTAQMRQKRIAIELRSKELEDLIGRYASILERLEAEPDQEKDASLKRREELRMVLTELAESTSAAAAAL